jgi:predicted ATPase with chaperone activity
VRPGEGVPRIAGSFFWTRRSSSSRCARRAASRRRQRRSHASWGADVPARFTLRAFSPCPCGWRDSRQRACTCEDATATLHGAPLRPLRDRIDLWVTMALVNRRRGDGRHRAERGGGWPRRPGLEAAPPAGDRQWRLPSAASALPTASVRRTASSCSAHVASACRHAGCIARRAWHARSRISRA